MKLTSLWIVWTSCLGCLLEAAQSAAATTDAHRTERSVESLLGILSSDSKSEGSPVKILREDSETGFLKESDSKNCEDGLSTIRQLENTPNHISDTRETQNHKEENPDVRLLIKRFNEFVGKRNYPYIADNPNFVKLQHNIPDNRWSPLPLRFTHHQKRQYDFVGKRQQSPNILSPDMSFDKPYLFIGKRALYDFIGKRNYDFIGKRSPYEFSYEQEPEDENSKNTLETRNFWSRKYKEAEHVPRGLSELIQKVEENKRYSEFLGRRRRNEESDELSLADSERLAALLQNNSLRKRLSRMLLSQRLAEHYPGFVGK